MARKKPKTQRISDEDIRQMMLQMCAAAGRDSAVRPEDIAMEISVNDWQPLLKRIRLFAKQLALAGEIEILRKGEPADPNDFKGVIRLRITDAFLNGEDRLV